MEMIYLAKWESRFWAWLIDIFIVNAILNLFSGIFAFEWGIDLLTFEGFSANGIVMFVYWTFFEGYNGQSIGKMALNLKITGSKGQKINIGVAALESFGKAFILPLDCLIGWLAMPESNLRLFNRVSDTIVIKVPKEVSSDIKYIKEGE